nr:unnamed protein product [Callosobruchus chinensis]
MLNAGIDMLNHLGHTQHAELITKAMVKTIVKIRFTHQVGYFTLPQHILFGMSANFQNDFENIWIVEKYLYTL